MRKIRQWISVLRDRSGHEDTDAALRKMLPGMMAEQAAAVLLANVNIFVMGFISTEALAGVGQISTLNSILMNAFQAFSLGGTAIVARAVGAGNREEAEAHATAALMLGGLSSLLLTGVIWSMRFSLVHLLFGAAERPVIENSLTYFNYTALAPVMWFFYFQCCGFMRSAGDTKTPMLISIVLNVLSISLNLLFSLGMGMGVGGSALAYICSVTVSAVLSFVMLQRRGSFLRLSLCSLRGMKKGISEIAAIAFPSASENLAFNGSRIVLQMMLAGMGTAMISANQVFNSVNEILMIPFMSIYFLIVPLVGLSAGTGQREHVKATVSHLVRRSMLWAFVIGLAHFVLCVPLSWLFTRDPEVIHIASRMLVIFGVISPLQATCFVLPNGMKAVGDARFPMVFSTLTAWLIRVLGTWVLGIRLGWGAYAIIVTQAMDYVARSLAYILRFRRGKWLKKLD